MMYTASYEMFKCEHGLTTAAEQRAADARAGEVAGAMATVLGDLRLGLGRMFHLGQRVRLAGGAADAVTAPARVLSSVR